MKKFTVILLSILALSIVVIYLLTHSKQMEDHDHDGYAQCNGKSDGQCDCDDDLNSGGELASFCVSPEGKFLMINFGNDSYQVRPGCSAGSTLLFETDGSFLNGPQVVGHDTSHDGFDNDCDGRVDEGEPGLNNCIWTSFEGNLFRVSCPWMEAIPGTFK